MQQIGNAAFREMRLEQLLETKVTVSGMSSLGPDVQGQQAATPLQDLVCSSRGYIVHMYMMHLAM